MKEWRKVKSNSNYSVSNDGEVRRDDTKHIKAPIRNRDGYDKVDLYEGGKRTTKRIHRLVGEAFIPNPENKPEINHKDGNKLNNHVSNLEWTTKRENIDHAVEHGLLNGRNPSYGMRGKKNPNGGAHGKPVRIVETGEIFKNIKECSVCKNCKARGITECLHGRQHTHRGFHFEFV